MNTHIKIKTNRFIALQLSLQIVNWKLHLRQLKTTINLLELN